MTYIGSAVSERTRLLAKAVGNHPSMASIREFHNATATGKLGIVARASANVASNALGVGDVTTALRNTHSAAIAGNQAAASAAKNAANTGSTSLRLLRQMDNRLDSSVRLQQQTVRTIDIFRAQAHTDALMLRDELRHLRSSGGGGLGNALAQALERGGIGQALKRLGGGNSDRPGSGPGIDKMPIRSLLAALGLTTAVMNAPDLGTEEGRKRLGETLETIDNFNKKVSDWSNGFFGKTNVADQFAENAGQWVRDVFNQKAAIQAGNTVKEAVENTLLGAVKGLGDSASGLVDAAKRALDSATQQVKTGSPYGSLSTAPSTPRSSADVATAAALLRSVQTDAGRAPGDARGFGRDRSTSRVKKPYFRITDDGVDYSGAGPTLPSPQDLERAATPSQRQPGMATGGVLTQPGVFVTNNSVRKLAENGSEGVLPLARMPDGTMGVRSLGAGSGATANLQGAKLDATIGVQNSDTVTLGKVNNLVIMGGGPSGGAGSGFRGFGSSAASGGGDFGGGSGGAGASSGLVGGGTASQDGIGLGSGGGGGGGGGGSSASSGGGRRSRRGGGGGADAKEVGPHTTLRKMGAKFAAKAPVIMDGLMKKYGLTRAQAAGIVGNLGEESAGFTAYQEKGKTNGKGGVGWAQWTGVRRKQFEAWAAAKGLDPTSDEASWRYLTEGDPETAKAIAAVKRTKTAHEAVRAWHDAFERSGDIKNGVIVKQKNWNARLDYADKAEGSDIGGATATAEATASAATPNSAGSETAASARQASEAAATPAGLKPVGDGEYFAARNRKIAGKPVAGDKDLMARYLREQNTPPAARQKMSAAGQNRPADADERLRASRPVDSAAVAKKFGVGGDGTQNESDYGKNAGANIDTIAYRPGLDAARVTGRGGAASLGAHTDWSNSDVTGQTDYNAAMLAKANRDAGLNSGESPQVFGQVMHEGGLENKAESTHYSARRLMQVFPRMFPTLHSAQAVVRQGDAAVANRIYGHRMGNTAPGDGNLYRGRGFNQLTGKDGYRRMGAAIGVDLVKHPEALNDPVVAAQVTAEYYRQAKQKGANISTPYGATKATAPQGWRDQVGERGRMAAPYVGQTDGLADQGDAMLAKPSTDSSLMPKDGARAGSPSTDTSGVSAAQARGGTSQTAPTPQAPIAAPKAKSDSTPSPPPMTSAMLGSPITHDSTGLIVTNTGVG